MNAAGLADHLLLQILPRLLDNLIASGVYDWIQTQIGVAERHERSDIIPFNRDSLHSKQTVGKDV